MKKIIAILFLFSLNVCYSQNVVFKVGDLFPNHIIRNIINAPVKEYNLRKNNSKILILNFWGTWCSPCIPKMDSLAKLQEKNKKDLQIIAISDDSKLRLVKYLQRKPSKIWLTSDTGYLYTLFQFNYVGQSVIVNRQNRIIAFSRSDSINQNFIDKILKGEQVFSSADRGGPEKIAEKDLFGVDSSALSSVSLKSYLSGLRSMGKSYRQTLFEGRRMTYINVCIPIMYKDAYDIHSDKQIVYENIDKKEACNFKDTSSLYSFDLLIKPTQKDSLLLIMQKTFNLLLPIKARVEKKLMPVYIIKQKASAQMQIHASDSLHSNYGFSGRGFEGTGIKMKIFMDYLANDLDSPIVDETNFTGKYDIKTENVLRSKEDIIKALDSLGLSIEKGERNMDVLIMYK